MLSEHDIYLLREGTHCRLYRSLGSHPSPDGDDRSGGSSGEGVAFAVWAPNARAVHVSGDWNGWAQHSDALQARADSSGIWEGWAPGARTGQRYKYNITTADGRVLAKADPFARAAENPPATASRIWRDTHVWQDAEWMRTRGARNALDAPMSIYEVHAGSWKRPGGEFPGYRKLAHELADHAVGMGFTHVELMPLTEHPFYGSWGYQTTGYFAATARYGNPDDLRYLVDHLHQRGLGVILDWAPAHFPEDAHGLAGFDGTALYEHADPRQGKHPEWHSCIFNYARHEVRAFLLSSALFWLDQFHIDGLRVDGVASMLYLDYAREPGEWIPNVQGGRENLAAVEFVRALNQAVYREYPDCLTIAEESTSWPQVTRPVHDGGLGFGMKWNMGWMHDTLDYFDQQPLFRKHHHNRMTFSLIYAFNENFVLPLSHDEVVHGKRSLLARMPGQGAQQFAHLRALYGYMWGHPGKKLLFMGGEFAQRREWDHDGELEWWASSLPGHRDVQHWLADLNRVYREQPALWQIDFSHEGFSWVVADDADHSVFAFLRKGRADSNHSNRQSQVLVVCNLTPVLRTGWRIGVPQAGTWHELLNSDATAYGGSGSGNLGAVPAEARASHGLPYSLLLTLPPLSTLYLVPDA